MKKENNKEKKEIKTEENKTSTAIETLKEPMALGEVFVESGMFVDIKSQAQAVVKILAGRELGLSPLQSMTDIYIVNGKVALQAKLIAALIKKSGKYDYIVDRLDSEGCIISFYQISDGKKEKIGESFFNRQDAIVAGLINKQSWRAYPRDMYFARTISMGGRRFCPDVITAYTPEEVEDINVTSLQPLKETVTIDANGEVNKQTKANSPVLPQDSLAHSQ